MVIVLRQTGSAARRAEIPWLTGREEREVSLAGQVGILEVRRVPEELAIAVVSVIAGSVIGAALPEAGSAIVAAWEPAVASAIAVAWETAVVLAIAVAWEVVAALAIAAVSEAAVLVIAGASAGAIASATGEWATVQEIVGVLVASAAADRAAAAIVAPPA